MESCAQSPLHFLRVSLFECFLPLAILALPFWDLVISVFSYHIAFSLFPLFFPSLFLLLPLLFPFSLVGLPNLVSPFSLLGFLSRGVFCNSHRMESVLLLYVPCHCTGILLLLAILSNCLVYSWYSILGTLQFLDWSFLFDHLFMDGRPLTLLSWFLMLCTVLPWMLMQIEILYRWWSSLVCHVFSIYRPDISLLLHLRRLKLL